MKRSKHILKIFFISRQKMDSLLKNQAYYDMKAELLSDIVDIEKKDEKQRKEKKLRAIYDTKFLSLVRQLIKAMRDSELLIRALDELFEFKEELLLEILKKDLETEETESDRDFE